MDELKDKILPNEFKFPTFGDAYLVLQDFYFLGNSQDYVTYYDLKEIIKKRNLAYWVGIDGEFKEPTPLATNIAKAFGWNEAGDIRIDKPKKCMADPLCDQNVIYFPKVKQLKIIGGEY